MQFSLVIPTYKRPDALLPTVESVLCNTLLPQEILIIDDDELDVVFITKLEAMAKQKDTKINYFKKDHNKIRRGLSESKNLAVTLATNEIIFYLDDDVVLDTEYFESAIAVWKSSETEHKLIGVGGRISNNRKTSNFEKYYRALFGLSGECSWDVNTVGFQVWDEGVKSTQKSYYLHGGVSSYKKELLLEYPFATFSGGRTGLEDVEHCLRAKLAGYYFYYVPSSHLTHHPASAGREAVYAAAKKESINRRAIWRNHCSHTFISRANFVRANIGWVGKKILSLQFISATGLIVGLLTP